MNETTEPTRPTDEQAEADVTQKMMEANRKTLEGLHETLDADDPNLHLVDALEMLDQEKNAELIYNLLGVLLADMEGLNRLCTSFFYQLSQIMGDQDEDGPPMSFAVKVVTVPRDIAQLLRKVQGGQIKEIPADNLPAPTLSIGGEFKA